jgi:hypothetical protein
MLQQQLLQEEKGSLVRNSLTDSNNSSPSTSGERRLTCVALLVPDRKLEQGRLLQNRAVHNFFLYRNLNLQSHGMRLCPDPYCIHQLHFVETVYFPQAARHELLRLQLELLPGRTQEPPTASARMDGQLTIDSISDINVLSDTGNAHVGRIVLNFRSTHTTQNGRRIFDHHVHSFKLTLCKQFSLTVLPQLLVSLDTPMKSSQYPFQVMETHTNWN